MYLGYQNEKIVLVADTYEELANNKFMKFDNIVETEDEYVLYNGQYLLKSEAESEEEAAEKQAHIDELHSQLDTLDLKTIRALRAIQAGVGTEADTEKLAELEDQAEQVRAQLKELGA